MTRAAIYVRVSSELQAEKVSPAEQEADAREYAQAQGYEVVEVYRDIERYRVGGRLVEPSGTRPDRPGFQKMIADARAGLFDVIVAWREDRLYRGLKPLIEVLDLVEEGIVDIDLVKETFDKSIAGIKASVAKMEIDAFRERTHLGVKARLKAGKLWGGHLKYGYTRDGDQLAIHPEEAKWVRQIFDWYTSGVGVREISRRLIAEGAPQKKGQERKLPWQQSTIYRIINSEMYATGIHKVRRDGQVFELPAPKIIDMKTFQKAQEIKEGNKSYRARNVKYNYLLRGLITSPCGTSWNAYTRERTKTWTKKSTGEEKEYQAIHSYYRCARTTTTSGRKWHHADCPRTKGRIRLDRMVWEKVSDVLKDPGILLEATSRRREELKNRHKDAAAQVKKLESELEKIRLQRDAYVEKYGADRARGGPFTEEDLNRALERLTVEETRIKRELSELELLADSRIADLEDLVEDYLEDIRAGLEWLDREPESDEEKEEQFKERRKIVEALVEKVILRKSRDPEIVFRLDLSPLLQSNSKDS